MSFLGLGDLIGGITDAIGLTNHSAQSGAQNNANKAYQAGSADLAGLNKTGAALQQQGGAAYQSANQQQLNLLGQLGNQAGLYNMTPQQQQQLNSMIGMLHQNHMAAVNQVRSHLQGLGIYDPSAVEGAIGNLHQQFGQNLSNLQNQFAQQTYQQNLANINQMYSDYGQLASQGLNMQSQGINTLANVANSQMGASNMQQNTANMYNQQNQANIGSALSMGAFVAGGGLSSPFGSMATSGAPAQNVGAVVNPLTGAMTTPLQQQSPALQMLYGTPFGG
jgi:hypothetical protein